MSTNTQRFAIINILCQPTVKYSTTYQRWTRTHSFQLPFFSGFLTSPPILPSIRRQHFLRNLPPIYTTQIICLQFQTQFPALAPFYQLNHFKFAASVCLILSTTSMADLDHSTSDDNSVDSRGTPLKFDVNFPIILLGFSNFLLHCLTWIKTFQEPRGPLSIH